MVDRTVPVEGPTAYRDSRGWWQASCPEPGCGKRQMFPTAKGSKKFLNQHKACWQKHWASVRSSVDEEGK